MSESRDADLPEAHGPIDETDLAILDDLAALYTAVDPVPHGLVERIQFAMALDDLDVAVMRLADETVAGVGARGEGSRIYTFEESGLSLTVRVAGLADDAVRIDGWLAPPAAHRITLRVAGRLIDRVADREGRFVVERTPTGPARIFVRAADGSDLWESTLATPEVML